MIYNISFWELGNKRSGTNRILYTEPRYKNAHNTSNTYCTLSMQILFACLVSPSLQTLHQWSVGARWGVILHMITHLTYLYTGLTYYNLVNSLLFRLNNETEYAVVELLILYKILIVHLFILEVNIRWKTNQIMCVMYGIQYFKPYALYIFRVNL